MDNIRGTMSPTSINVSGFISQKVLQGLSAYQIAVANGFQGTQAQWLQSLRGERIQFRSDGLTIYYKYETDENWTTLVSIDQLMADYSVLDNKPSINDVELDGNKTLDELGIQAKGNYVEEQAGYGLISDVEKERLSHVDNYDDSEVRQAIEAIILNAVTGIKGAAESTYRKGNVNITPENIGLGNVDNTHDADKNVLSAVQDAEGNVIDETYFSGIDETNGEVFLVRPDGSTQKLMNSKHNHDASEIVSGTIDIARLPAGALDRLVTVANQAQRYALTRNQVQTGDTVQQEDTGIMYRVIDDTKLNSGAGYRQYTAARASAVPWSGIENKPQTYTPSAHTHTMADITDLVVTDAETIANFETSNTDTFSDVWFSHPLTINKPVHNSGIQYNPVKDILKVGNVQGALKGNADTATALTTDAGSATQPVYFYNGKPVATTYQLNKTVPADAVFTDTDTHYASDIVVAGNFNSKVDTTIALTNGNVYINHIENDQVTSSHKIIGSGTATVTTDEHGNIIINATGQSYIQGAGIAINEYVITNTGVRSISQSTVRGTITANINGVATNIPVFGLGTAAYTDATDYAVSAHKHSFADLQNKPTTLTGYGITDAAASSHNHDASEITSGTIDIARLPAGALEKLVTVANETARFALTKTQVQNGDTVQQEDTGVMYRVVDEDNLDKPSGYREYVAAAASSAPWSGITGKPETFTPSAHSHSVADISDIATAIVAKAGELTTARTIALAGAVTGSGSFDGSGDITITTEANHTHQYAGSQTIGGPANSAVRLESASIGSSAVPVYFYDGRPVAMDYQLNKSVPADAVFTDTHYSSTTVINSAEDSTTNSTRAISNGNVFINHIENGEVKASHRIEGTGSVTVTYNAQGDLIINGTGQDYTALPNPYALSINGSTYDGSAAVDVGIIDVAHGGTGNSAVDSAPTQESSRMVTSGGVYTALQGKANTSHTHQYAGSATEGGAAKSAVMLTSDAGSATQPIYFFQGKPVATTYELNATVPADALFTDTHHTSKTVVAGAASQILDSAITVANGHVFINHVENGVVRSAHRISGSGSATVTTDNSGNIIIAATDTKYTALKNPYALSINGKTYDGDAAVDVGIIDVAHGGTGNSSVDSAPVENSTKMLPSGAIYTALQGKADSVHTHMYAGSSSSGGSASSAVKLDSDAGSTTQPIYFSGGKPVVTAYELNASVPADAVFTDTHYASKTVVAGSNDAVVNSAISLANAKVFLNHVENGVVVSSHRISGSGAATVTTDTNGNIIISAEDTKYTVLPNPYSLSVNGKTYDGSESIDVGVIDVAHGGTGNSTVDTSPVEDSTKMVTSGGIYTALQGKADSGHTHLYAGSLTVGGSAISAAKLDSDAGSLTQPVFFSGGKPTATTHTLAASVPADAIFTDTHYASKTVIAGSNSAIVDTTATLANTKVFMNHVENGVVVSSHRISGTGSATVTADINGHIIINAEDTKYTALPNPYALTIQANGTSLGTYDGTSAESFNITYSNVGAAAVSHSHAWNDLTSHPTTLAGYGITDQLASKTHIHDASEIQSGVFDIARIPVGALERLITVADETAMYALTTSEVQVGDTVQLEDTGVMYRVVDTDNLDNADGYRQYIAGVASSVPWTGITGKPSTFTPSEHTHLYAGSSVAGGSADSAEKLNPLTDAGSATQPVYFSGGKPAATTYSLNATVPANAVFTDTHHTAKLVTTNEATGKTQSSSVIGNGNVYLNLVENDTVRSAHKITGSGATTVTTDASGNIVISSTDSDTKYSPGTGINITGTTISNAGVRAIDTGETNGTISVNTNGTTAEVAVKGLGSAAYTNSSAYAASGHTHKYAGSSVAGGSADSAVKLDTSTAGSATQPVYFTGGKPEACTYSLNATVPADAVFTDTHHQAKLIVGNLATATTQSTTALTNGNVYLNLVENGAVRSSHKITGGTDVTVVTDTSGNITINSSDTKYSGSDGILLTGTNFTNSGVRSISTGSTNGTISVNTGGTSAEVAVKGLGTAAYTASTAYATAGHDHTLSIAADNGTSAITLEPKSIYKLTAGGKTFIFTTPSDTKYDQGTGITISGTTISNSGVRSIATGTANGTISVNTNGTSANVAVKGLGSAAYTDSSAYAGASHTHNYAGSSSAGGAANSAAKLTSAVKIKVDLGTTSANGVDFDGSAVTTLGVTGTLSVGRGGTGATTLTKWGVLYGNADGAIQATGVGTSGYVLQANGSAAPSWADMSEMTAGKAAVLSNKRYLLVTLGTASTTGVQFDGSADRKDIPITGTLGVGHGGTGKTTLTANGILYGNGSSEVGVTAAGTNGYFLIAKGSTTAPAWANPSELTVGAANKLSSGRTITLSGAVTGSVSFDGSVNVTLSTSANHNHDASHITAGTLAVARGGTGYGSTDTKPVNGSKKMVESGGIHKRIAYKKVTLSPSGWSAWPWYDTETKTEVYRQAIATSNDILATTEVVSVKMVGSMVDEYTTISYSDPFTGDGSTTSFTLSHAPTVINSITWGGATVATSKYTFSGNVVTFTETPNTGISIVVNYSVIYDNNEEFSKLVQVETAASLLEFRAYSTPLIPLTLVVGYVTEELDTVSTQGTLLTLSSRYFQNASLHA